MSAGSDVYWGHSLCQQVFFGGIGRTWKSEGSLFFIWRKIGRFLGGRGRSVLAVQVENRESGHGGGIELFEGVFECIEISREEWHQSEFI